MKFFAIAVFALLIVSTIGCAPKGLPLELKPAYTANEVLIRVQELQNTVISLYDATPRGITKDRADILVKFTVTTASVIKSSLAGWQSTVKASWAELKKNFTPTEVKLQTIWNLVDAMMGVL